CASGTIAVGEAFHTIREGRADVMLAGGAEAPLAPMTYAAFSVIRAMSTRNDDPAHASRPFDEDRDGFVMGEGAAVLVLEERTRAVARGARIYAELAGYAFTNDAYHMTAPRPDGREAARAMRLAIADAHVAPADVGYINAHGSSTPLNDSTETAAIKQVFGAHAYRLSVSGTKGYYGHALGASGAIEAAICALGDHRRQHRSARRRPGARSRHGDHRLDDDEHLRPPHKSRGYVRPVDREPRRRPRRVAIHRRPGGRRGRGRGARENGPAPHGGRPRAGGHAAARQRRHIPAGRVDRSDAHVLP